jgi:hypothetical protein
VKIVQIDNDMLARAKHMASELGKLRHSITSGDGNLAGFVGEIAVASLTGAKHANTYDYDLTLGPTRIDVKTKRTSLAPKPHYACSVADFNTKQDCDWYAFVRVSYDNRTAWVLGYLPKLEFYSRAKFCRAGEVDPSNNFTFKADCYNIPIASLSELGAPEKPVLAPAVVQPVAGFDWLYKLQKTVENDTDFPLG